MNTFHKIVCRMSLLVICMVTGGMRQLTAQVPLPEEEKNEIITKVTKDWNEWKSVAISGKFKMAGLSVSPGVKIYMQRDSMILISLRAPFVGEVGRAELTDSTILVVNKMNKTYVEEPLEKALSYYPGGISDIQDLLLARIPIAGFGTLSTDIEESVDVYGEEDGTATIVVNQDGAIEGFNYGFVIGSDFYPSSLMVIPLSMIDTVVTMIYEYYENGYDLTFQYQSEKKHYRATLELDNPEWDGKPFDRIKLNSKYNKVDFQKFLKSF